MFSFHKPKIYRSNSGCCICRAKSSSSRFTDSKKYEPEFEKCFRIDEKRSGEICNACVLLVKRWKKLPSGTNKNWHHVVDARAGPGTKSFKTKSINSTANSGNISSTVSSKKSRLNSSSSSSSSSASSSPSSSATKVSKTNRSNNNTNGKMFHVADQFNHRQRHHRRPASTSSSESDRESDSLDDVDVGIEDDLTLDSDHDVKRSSSSLRRSTRLARGKNRSHRKRSFVESRKSITDINDANTSSKTSKTTYLDADNQNGSRRKRNQRKAVKHNRNIDHQLVSFIDANFWRREKICCGIIFKGLNNEVLIYPELFQPCGCRSSSSSSPSPSASRSSLSSGADSACDKNSSDKKQEKATAELDSTKSMPELIKQQSFDLNESLNADGSDQSPTNKMPRESLEQSSGNKNGNNQQQSNDSYQTTENPVESSMVSVNEHCDENSMQDSIIDSSDHLSTVSSSLIDQDDGNLSSSSETFENEPDDDDLVKSTPRNHSHHSATKTSTNPLAVV